MLDAAKWQAQPGTPEESCMVGDVNLFLTDLGDPTLGEIEVMIAGSFAPFWAWDLQGLMGGSGLGEPSTWPGQTWHC